MNKLNVGIGSAHHRVGDTITTQCSDTWEVGDILTTWAGYRCEVRTREGNLPLLGSWKYTYQLVVIALEPRAARRLERQEVK